MTKCLDLYLGYLLYQLFYNTVIESNLSKTYKHRKGVASIDSTNQTTTTKQTKTQKSSKRDIVIVNRI